MGRTVKSDPRIPMENYLVWQPDGLFYTIYFVFGPKKFISIERTSDLGLSAEELIQFAANIGKEIKDYKYKHFNDLLVFINSRQAGEVFFPEKSGGFSKQSFGIEIS